MHASYDIAAIMGGVYGDGIIGLRGALSREWVKTLAREIDVLFADALARPGGTVGRGPRRYYVEIHPERLSGFVDLVMHPWVAAVCEAVLGSGYEIVELGFDVPCAGAVDQPWHRDFPAPAETTTGRRITSLAFNVTTVDVDETMGPFEVAPGTQWDDDADFAHAMFPPTAHYQRYAARAERKTPRMGDISARSGLTVHRGTANRSERARPVLVLGAVAEGMSDADAHVLEVTKPYWRGLPRQVQSHLFCRLVDTLEPITQRHSIEGLVMGGA
jgi:hypothetical protein